MGIRILIVEDEADLADFIVRGLREEGFAVESVVDARPGASDTVSDEFADELLEGDEAALPRGGIDLKDHLSAIEIGLIRKALEEADGTVAGAARLLNIRRTTLVEKLRKYRLSA